MNPRVPRVAATAALCTLAFSAMCVAAVAVALEDARQEHGAALEFGMGCHD
jgi:hypothetical protein